MKYITDNLYKEIKDIVDSWDSSNEDCFEAAAEMIFIINQAVRDADTILYRHVEWPESQMYMENESCIPSDNMSYFVPIELLNNNEK